MPRLDFIHMGAEELVAVIIVTSFAAGLNVYATVAALGVLDRTGVIALPSALSPIADWWVIGLASAMFVVEFFADKIPAFDLAWNALHTFVRVPAGALIAFAATTPLSPGAQLFATALGGAIAFAAHAGKTAVRAAATASPEPFSNIALSVAEDALSLFLIWFATRHPYLAAAIVLALLVAIVVVVRWIVRTLLSLARGARRPLASR